MEIQAIASGSKGNAYFISDGSTELLIECGVSMKKLSQSKHFLLTEIDGVLISHRHGDHCCSIKQCNEAGVALYAPADVFESKEVHGNSCHCVKPFQGFVIGTLFIIPFDLNHDCTNYGYLICSRNTGERVLYFTDTYFVKYKFEGLTHIMAECNYSKKILAENVRLGLVPVWLKDRIKVSHMSVENLLEMLSENDLSNVSNIYLIHISENNGSPAVFRHMVKKATGKHVDVFR